MMHSFKFCLDHTDDVGHVEEVKESLVWVSGLSGAVVGEGVTFKSGEHGRVQALNRDLVEVMVLSKQPIKPKTRVARTGLPLTLSCGMGLLGHTIDTLGYSLTTRRKKSAEPENRPIETMPVGIGAREKINRFFETGVSAVDLLIPLGMGQRELVIGDRTTGKTHFLMQTLLSQARAGRICIFTAIGKRKVEIKAIEEFLKKEKIWQKCLIVVADCHASPGEIFLAPYTAMTLAEYFRDQGRDVFLILDDLTTHAKYYREISLLGGRFPGRESYPGDIFHVHSKLLERAGCFRLDGKQGSITCLPVAECVSGDFTGYIQTNLMSMTDGHIYFDSELFFKGVRPAVNIFLSVTRVGRQTQTPLLRDIGKKLLTLLKKYEDAQRFLRFGPEMGEEMKGTLHLGEILNNFFSQVGYQTLPTSLQAALVSLVWQNTWDGKDSHKFIKAYESEPFRTKVNNLVEKSQTLEELNTAIGQEREIFNF